MRSWKKSPPPKPIGPKAIKAAADAVKPDQTIPGTKQETPGRDADLAARHPIGKGAARSGIEAMRRRK